MTRKTIILYSQHEEVARFPIDEKLDYIFSHTPQNEDEDLLGVSVGGKTYYCDEIEFI